MNFEEVQSGGYVRKGSHCKGKSTLNNVCAKPTGLEVECSDEGALNVCEKPENLVSKAGRPVDNICCGGGTLHVSGESFGGGGCDGDTSLCEGDDDLYASKKS